MEKQRDRTKSIRTNGKSVWTTGCMELREQKKALKVVIAFSFHSSCIDSASFIGSGLLLLLQILKPAWWRKETFKLCPIYHQCCTPRCPHEGLFKQCNFCSVFIPSFHSKPGKLCLSITSVLDELLSVII